MKPGYQWSFWTTGFWMALKFFSWNLSHSHKPLINFCCKFVHFNTTKAWSNFIFYQINYQALTNLVPRVLSFSSHSGGRVGEVPGNDEVELWPLLLFQMARFKCVNLTQSWCFMMSESSVGGNCIRGSYLPSKIIFFTSKSFLNGSRCVSFMFDLFAEFQISVIWRPFVKEMTLWPTWWIILEIGPQLLLIGCFTLSPEAWERELKCCVISHKRLTR